jgi:hypothetical protein
VPTSGAAIATANSRLQLAAWGGHLDAVKWLLERGAPLEREGKQWGALHYAVFNGHEKVVNDLMARGANVNARAPNGSTPLMLAAREGHDGLARTLLEAGANPKMQSDWGDTALTMAMRYDHLRLAKMISSPEEFAIAVKAPKESFGDATRSAAVPSAIDAILKEIRAAEAEGRPSEDLHKKLRAAVNELRRGTSGPLAQRPMPRPYQPRSMVITARRSQPGAERAQLVVDGSCRPGRSSRDRRQRCREDAEPNAAAQTRSLAAAQAADLLRQIRLAEAQGRPADETPAAALSGGRSDEAVAVSAVALIPGHSRSARKRCSSRLRKRRPRSLGAMRCRSRSIRPSVWPGAGCARC